MALRSVFQVIMVSVALWLAAAGATVAAPATPTAVAPAPAPAAKLVIPLAAAGAKPAPAGVAEAPVPPPVPSPKALHYYRSGNVLWFVRLVWGLLFPTVLLVGGWSARMRDWAVGLADRWFLIIGLYWLVFAGVDYVVSWPLDFYVGFVREHSYGLSNQGFGRWLWHSLKALFLSVVLGGGLVMLLYWVLRRSPRRWWLIGSGLAAPIIVFLMLVEPIVIDPLFNRFGPMKDETLQKEILSLAARANIADGRVFEVDKSADTKAINAYVTGIFRTQRIVLWDTAIEKLKGPRLLSVMGHEMGHYVLNHVWKGIAAALLAVCVSLFLIHRAAEYALSAGKAVFGFEKLADVASFPLLVLLVQVAAFLIAPAANAFSRHLEHEADRFALELTHNNRAAAEAFVQLQEANLSNPRPGWIYKLLRASHPSLADRVAFCNEYHPWKERQPGRYEGRFKPATP